MSGDQLHSPSGPRWTLQVNRCENPVKFQSQNSGYLIFKDTHLHSPLCCYKTQGSRPHVLFEGYLLSLFWGVASTYMLRIVNSIVRSTLENRAPLFFNSTSTILRTPEICNNAAIRLATSLPIWTPLPTVDSKIIQTFLIILAILLRFDCQFLSSRACYKQYKA